jgi:molybdopterin-synthase adenylyltransferase
MNLDRYNRQILLPFMGAEGQKRICASTAVVAGCGALGSTICNVLARAGVGHLRVIDRDFVEESNLHRQVLFDEDDCRASLPKAAAAERKLRETNSTIAVTGSVVDINPANVEELIKGADVVVDGTDNFETRFLINDACVKHGIPWIYGAAVGETGLSLSILPGETPCLRCVFDSPPPGLTPTCDVAGVLGALTGLIGSYEACEALKICAGQRAAVNRRLLSVNLWSGELRLINVAKARAADCPACQQRRFEFLEGSGASSTTSLCGRNAVQINPRGGHTLDLAELAGRLKAATGVRNVVSNQFLLKFSAPGGDDGQGLEITVFPDSRAIIRGTKKVAEARTAYA